MFFKLTANGWIELYTKLTKSELGLLYYIRSLDPFGDCEIEISTSEIAERLHISVRTVQRALASLKAKGLIVAKYVRTCYGGSTMSSSDDIVVEATQSDTNMTSNVVEATLVSHSHSSTHTQQASQKPETNKTKNKTKDSLSELVKKLSKEEREKFLEFAFNKVDELPKRPTLPKKWIAANLEDLYSEFKKQSAPEVQKATQDAQFRQWYDLMRSLGHLKGQRIENGVQMVEDTSGLWSTYEHKAKFWSMEYLKKCVGGR